LKAEINISNATIRDIEAIIKIVTNTLGNQYLTHAQINQYLENINFYCHKAIINNEIVGFSLSRICRINDLKHNLLGNTDYLDDDEKLKEPILFRETTAIKKEFQRKGIGTKLIQYGIDIAKNKAHTIFRVAWQQKDITPIGKIIEKEGAKILKKIPNYWYEDSLKRKYQCQVCGAPPCKCSAIIYIDYL